MTVLVTGGAGYFGEILSKKLLESGQKVRVFDLNPPGFSHPSLEYQIGDIRDSAAVRRACEGAKIVHHNVAQVPLAKDKKQFWSVNRDGTRNLLETATAAGVGKFVYTSSSAVFGVPKSNPVTEATEPSPAEDYGRAKYEGELLCREIHETKGLDCSIIRPRTILGHGRLGIVELLFHWIHQGAPVPVFDGGRNVYQFVHSDDLADACIAAGNRSGWGVYNIGAKEFGSMRALLAAAIDEANSTSRIKSLPMRPMQALMNITSATGLSPLGPYHALMYGRSMYFDISAAERDLDYKPVYSNESAIRESYRWYAEHRENLNAAGKSHHQSPLKRGIMALAPLVLRFAPEAREKAA